MIPKIPKIIHYCWFGQKEKPNLTNKCISSWKEYLPDFQLIEWNEDNFDFSHCLFAHQAYKAEKFAFVADYVRACVLYKYGGIYMDTDMEVLRKFNSSMLMDNAFAGCERIGLINAAILGAIPNNFWMKEIKEYYEKIPFIKENGCYNSIPIVTILTLFCKRLGYLDNDEHQFLDGNIHIYPVEYFYPKSYETNKVRFTDNTVTIHYFAGSWLPFRERLFNMVCKPLKRIGVYEYLYPIMKSIFRFICAGRETH
jgi:hypothetical protein